jgi:hypothetical protein
MENTPTPPKKSSASFPVRQVSMRKPSGLNNRKGLPNKYNPNNVIDDEEYLLSQTPAKPGHLN